MTIAHSRRAGFSACEESEVDVVVCRGWHYYRTTTGLLLAELAYCCE
jgi:hypothetical protein